MFTTKKAQMEIMGLAVIVILLALGMFFLTKFTLLSEKSNTPQIAQQKQFASNFLNTYLNTNAGCEDSSATFAKLIDDIETPEFSLLSCDDGSLRDYLVTSTSTLLNQTLSVWGPEGGYKYEFIVQFPTAANVEDIVISHNCDTVQ